MRTIEVKIYTIEDHPNKEKCFEWIRNNWHDLNQHSINELIKSIEKLSETIGGTYDYSISQFPDRGEHITFKGYDNDELSKLDANELPLTGVFWDAELIEGLQNRTINKVLRVLHSESESVYSDEGLTELCIANEYEFTEDGEIYC